MSQIMALRNLTNYGMDVTAGDVDPSVWQPEESPGQPAGMPLTDWMGKLRGSTGLSSVSIPGTHDSGTFHPAGDLSDHIFAVVVNPWFTKENADLRNNDRPGVGFSDFFNSNLSYTLITRNYRKYHLNH